MSNILYYVIMDTKSESNLWKFSKKTPFHIVIDPNLSEEINIVCHNKLFLRNIYCYCLL